MRRLEGFLVWYGILLFSAGVGLVTCYVTNAYLSHASPQQVQPHVPTFTANQCFAKGLREPWDTDVAGIVIRKGYNKYLVMYASEADRNSLGAKQGWEEDIRSFDSKYVIAPCPETWITKKRTK